MESNLSPPVPNHIDFATVYPGFRFDGPTAILEAPFDFRPYGTNGDYLSTQIDYGYYKGSENANSISAIGRHISELQAHPERNLLIPKNATDCQFFNPIEAAATLKSLHLAPYHVKVVHPENPQWALCSYIQAHYALAVPASPQTWNTELWTPKQ